MKARLPKKILAFALCLALGVSSTLVAIADEEAPVGLVIGEPIADVSEGDASDGDNQNIINENHQDVTGGDVSGGNINKMELTAEVDGMIVKLTADAGTFPEGAVLSAESVMLPQEAEQAIADSESQKGATVNFFQALDITVRVDGEEVQPAEGKDVVVTFEGAAAEKEEDEEIAVYHVSEDSEVTEVENAIALMAAEQSSSFEVTEMELTDAVNEDDVAMITNHFSVYVIVNSGVGPIKITVEHYLPGGDDRYPEYGATMLYATDEYELAEKGTFIPNIVKAVNYDVQQIVKKSGNSWNGIQWDYNKENDQYTLEVTGNGTYRIYYSPSSEVTEGAVKFYDYQVQPTQKGVKSFNHADFYPQSDKDQRLTAGTTTQNADATKYTTYRTYNRTKRNINGYDSGFGGGKSPYTGIVTGVNVATGQLVMGTNSDGERLVEPGFFTDTIQANQAKQIYNDYKLVFNRVGDTYTLTQVNDKNGQNVATAGSDFFPLNSLKFLYQDNAGNSNNFYFGMRYDIKFTIGDYVGEMKYSFTGDDDLWVVLDGDQVIIDLGGIHGAATGTADLWEELGLDKNNLNQAEKDAEHTLTVLYMERGAGESNCQMTYTLPNSHIEDVVVPEKTSVTIHKVDEEGNDLTGAVFTLSNEDGQIVDSKADVGTATFDNLTNGSYTLEETTAPEGYVISGPWTVTIENGKAAIEDKNVEEIDKNEFNVINHPLVIDLEQNKSAKAYLDGNRITEDDRMFQIDLDASSLVTSSIGGGTKTIDLVLVLDRSNSMNYLAGVTGEKVTGSLSRQSTYYFEQDGELYKVSAGSRQKWTLSKYYFGVSNYSSGWTVQDNNYNPNLSITDYYTKTISRLQAMKDAVSEFLAALADRSPDSQVAIVTFAGSATTGKTLQNVSDNLNALQLYVSNIGTDSSTNTYAGLAAAEEVLTKAANEKHVVLLSDGNPTTKKTQAETLAGKMKNDNSITIHTIGFQIDEAGATHLQNVASPNCSHIVEGGISNLINSFDFILDSTIEGVTIPSATIRDYIDSRFILTDSQGKALQTGDRVSGGGIVGQDQNGYYVEWSSDIAPKKDVQPGWSATIFVKAKEDFMGGNMVPTNGEAYITVADKRFDFSDKPTVNVKPLDVAFGDDNATLFLGEMITPSKIIKKWVENKGLDLNENQITELLKNKSLEVPYSYTDNEGKYVYTLTVNDTADHTALETGEAENYSLSVQYVPASIAERAAALGDSYQRPSTDQADPSFDNIEYTGSQRAEGSCKVNVVEGSITVTKKIKKSDINYTQGDPIFTFKLEGKAANGNVDEDVTLYKAVRFSESAAVETDGGYVTLTVVFDGLKKGSYTVTELSAIRYDLNGLTAEGMGGNPVTLSSSADGAAKFALGMTQDFAVSQIAAAELDNADRLSARDGKAVFSNDKTGTSTKLTDTDVVKNTFSVKDGKVTSITGDWLDGKTTGTN